MAFGKLQCSGCGAKANAVCDCGVAYVTARERAAAALAKTPEKSDRAIAAEIGVNHTTVRDARTKTGVGNQTPERRIGRDGKSYPAQQKVRQPDPDNDHNDEEWAMTRFMFAVDDIIAAAREVTEYIDKVSLSVESVSKIERVGKKIIAAWNEAILSATKRKVQ